MRLRSKTSLKFKLWLNGVKSMINAYNFCSQSCINCAFWFEITSTVSAACQRVCLILTWICFDYIREVNSFIYYYPWCFLNFFVTQSLNYTLTFLQNVLSMTVSSTRHGLLNHQPIHVIDSHFFLPFFLFLLWGHRFSLAFVAQTGRQRSVLNPIGCRHPYLWITFIRPVIWKYSCG